MSSDRADLSDDALLARLRGQHPGAFDELYRRHAPRIWRFLRQLAGRRDLAEDLCQDTWVSAARHVHRLRDDTQLLPWLFTIARNKHRNALRLRAFDARRRAGVRGEPVTEPVRPDTAAEARGQASRVTAAFARLTEAHREVLLLCVVEGLGADEVGRVLDLREDAVRKRLSRARAELARTMGMHHEGGDPA